MKGFEEMAGGVGRKAATESVDLRTITGDEGEFWHILGYVSS